MMKSDVKERIAAAKRLKKIYKESFSLYIDESFEKIISDIKDESID